MRARILRGARHLRRYRAQHAERSSAASCPGDRLRLGRFLHWTRRAERLSGPASSATPVGTLPARDPIHRARRVQATDFHSIGTRNSLARSPWMERRARPRHSPRTVAAEPDTLYGRVWSGHLTAALAIRRGGESRFSATSRWSAGNSARATWRWRAAANPRPPAASQSRARRDPPARASHRR